MALPAARPRSSVFRINDIDAALRSCTHLVLKDDHRKGTKVFSWHSDVHLQFSRREVLSHRTWERGTPHESTVVLLKLRQEDLTALSRLQAHTKAVLQQDHPNERWVERSDLWSEPSCIVAREKEHRDEPLDLQTITADTLEQYALRFRVASNAVKPNPPLRSGDFISAIVKVAGVARHHYSGRTSVFNIIKAIRVDLRVAPSSLDLFDFLDDVDEPAPAAAAVALNQPGPASKVLPAVVLTPLEQALMLLLKPKITPEAPPGGAAIEAPEFLPEEPSDCVVCFAVTSDVVFAPCRHGVCCEGCAAQVSICPICRSKIEKRVPLSDVPEANRDAVWFS
jgi:hypothetical protein